MIATSFDYIHVQLDKVAVVVDRERKLQSEQVIIQREGNEERKKETQRERLLRR